jgi:thiol:disulfide interchange protein
MITNNKAIKLSVLLILLISCNVFASKSTETPASTSTSSANSMEPTNSSIATESSAATEVPVDLDAPYNENAVPSEDIETALARSEKDGKLVLLDFGANWCVDCLVLTVLFEDANVKPFLEENYHTVRIDVGMWDRNLDISEKYGSPIDNGIPAVVILSADGEIIATTKDGSLANARTATAPEILALLQNWIPK